MPPVCAMVSDATLAFSAQNVNDVDETLFAPGTSLVEAVNTMRFGAQQGLGGDAERDFFASYPTEVLEQIRHEIYTCLTASPRVPIAFAWLETGRHDVVSVSFPGGKSITILGPPH